MKLRKLVIENYRSLERVEIEDLQDVNIFVGKNNSGKSSISQALIFLRDIFPSPQSSRDILLRTDREKERDIFFELTFNFSGSERESYLKQEFSSNEQKNKDGRSPLIDSKFLTSFSARYRLSQESSYLESFSISGISSENISFIKQDDPNLPLFDSNNTLILNMQDTDFTYIKNLNQETYNKISTPKNESFATHQHPLINYLSKNIYNYLQTAYNFNIIRESDISQSAQEVYTLSTDGKILPVFC
jgi:AAA15 family ATPase/GTPase